jgi:hypothetical protein
MIAFFGRRRPAGFAPRNEVVYEGFKDHNRLTCNRADHVTRRCRGRLSTVRRRCVLIERMGRRFRSAQATDIESGIAGCSKFPRIEPTHVWL